MAMQLSTATKPTLKVRMFLQNNGLPSLEGTRTRREGGAYQGQELQARKVSTFELVDPLLGDKVGQHGRIDHVI